MIKHKISPAGRPGGAARPNRPKRVLLVDDERFLRQLYTEVLTDANYEVDTAEDGQVAWDALQGNRYDLLITDNDMPKVTGVDLLKKFHAARMTLPVIMVTGTDPGEELTRHPRLQPDVILLKPYSPEEFLQAVKETLCLNENVRAEMAPSPVWQIWRQSIASGLKALVRPNPFPIRQ